MIAGTRTVRSDAAGAIPWATIAWFAALTIICYAPVLYNLGRQWANDEDMGHGFFVPLVAGYIMWQRRAEVAAVVPAPNWWGLAVVLWGGAQLYVATLGAELFLARTSLVITIFGIVLFLGGPPLLRALLFPLALLFLMVPIPAIIYSQITFPLQIFASRVAEGALALLGIPVLREGNILELANQKLSVVEACSGIRSLLTLTFLSLVYAYFFDSKAWMRAALLIATVPIAIAANAARVTVTGILTEYDPELAEGVFHTAEGWVMFMIALAMLVATHAVINRIYGAVRGR
ncbi:MAG TPA: exosortase/archaeosortase family protein [Bryobacteraceae bacterium]|nr:exosortase/archaeosortase family protein [Bryobacteraceae bacterium]